jgi:hypothetical protein
MAPMAAAAAPPPRAAAPRGVIDRVLGAMRGGMRGARGVADGGDPQTRSRTLTPAPKPRRGVIRVINEHSLVVTLAFDEREAWPLPTEWTLRLEDGSELHLMVDAEHSTRAGMIEAGQEVRLVFALSGKRPAAAKLLLSRGAPSWEIALSR